MRKRWQVSEDQSTWEDVTPINGAKVTISESRDLDAGQIFFRKKLDTPLKFWKEDYTYIRGFERIEGRRCTPLYIRLQLQCGGWHTFWTGQFSAGSGKWDLTNCIFEVKPETVDRYTCLLSKKDVNVNILNTATVPFQLVLFPPNVQIWATTATDDGLGNPLSDYGWDQVDTQAVTFPNIGSCGGVIVGGSITVRIYWRQIADVPCTSSGSNPPPGTGWVHLTTDFGEGGAIGIPGGITCGSHGYERYVRVPSAAWPFPNDPIVVGPVSAYENGAPVGEIDFIEPPEPECNQWMRIGNRRGFCEALGLYICVDTASPESISNGRTVRSVVEYMLEMTGCADLNGVASDLLDWNPPGDAPGYVQGISYVTGETNTVDNLLIFQKSDVITPNATNPATIGDMSFEDIMTMLWVLLRVLWEIDDQGRLRIEHWSYWEAQPGLDLTNDELTPNEFLSYEHTGEKVPRIERSTFMEANGRDFVGLDIVYSGPCVNSNDIKEWNPGKVTTDIAYVLDSPSDIDKNGFVLVATRRVQVLLLDVYLALITDGAITGSLITNGPMSLANLQRDYWQHDRYLRHGNMNGQDVGFAAIRDNVEQNDVRASLCCKLISFDPRDYVTTRLGQALGVNASVRDVSHRIGDERSEINLSYAY